MEYTPLPRRFYDREPAEVAQELLGKLLVRKVGTHLMVGKIVETEAYLPFGDAAAHGFKGKTARNASMYKEGGHAYVHGMRQYFLLDIVTLGPDKPGGVLIRAVEPVEGIETPTNGPGKIGIAYKLSKADDGVDMTSASSGLFVARNKKAEPFDVVATGRIGISKAKDMDLRFYIAGNPHVSKAKLRLR